MAVEEHVASEARLRLDATIERLKRRIHDPVAMREANRRMDLAREEIRQRCGVVDVAVELIREVRDQ